MPGAGLLWIQSWTSEALQETNPDVNINNFQGTPLKVGDKLYIITAMNLISAIDAATGETLWTYNPEVYLSGPPVNIIGYHSRGVAYWSVGEEERILAGLNDGYLVSLDAKTGLPDPAFNGGKVDLSVGIPRANRDSLDYLGAQPVSVGFTSHRYRRHTCNLSDYPGPSAYARPSTDVGAGASIYALARQYGFFIPFL